MITQRDTQQGQYGGGQGPGQGPGGPGNPFQPPLPPPRRPGGSRGRLWILISIVVVVMLLATTFGTILLVRQAQRPGTGSQVTTTPTTGSTTIPASSPGIGDTSTPGSTHTPTPGQTLTPQPGPPVTSTAYWDTILGTRSGFNKVESVKIGPLMGNGSQQALVGVRYTGANQKLDVYVFTSITARKPIQVFHLAGLIKGQTAISGYNTILTMEVDTHSALNTGQAISAMSPDLFREFSWSAQVNTFAQTAFPGIFPDLTRYQAELDQARVNQGNDAWKNDPAKVARVLSTQFFQWQRAVTTTLLSGGGPRDVLASVRVQEAPAEGAQSQGPSAIVNLSRLEGNTHNIWEAIGVTDGTRLQLTNLDARQLITSPVTLEGMGTAFEAVIGQAVVYDHLYTDIGHAQVRSNVGMGTGPYSTSVIYTSSFKTGVQEGLVAVFEANGGISNETFTAVLVKVLLDPAPGVASGPLSCPDAVSTPTYWNQFVTTPGLPESVDQVNCGNLLGTPGLQAMVVAREILGGGPVYRDVFVFNNITAAHPTLLFKITHLLHGQAQISGYSSVLTGEVDKNSSLNKGKVDPILTVDLFREFQWSTGTGTFVQVAFPGLFPDLTRYQAELDQALVNQGQGRWKNDPASVSKALATTFLSWKHPLIARILSGGGPRDVDATVQVQEVLTQQGLQITGPTVTVTLSRLEGQTRNIWIAIGAQDGTAITLTNLQARSIISSPVTLKGGGDAFENTIGIAFVLDHLTNRVGQALLEGISGSGMGYLPYSVQVSYHLSFQQGRQEGIVEIRQTSPVGDGSAILVKVLLNPSA